MAPALSTLRRPSHPMFTRSPFDITKTLLPAISPGSTYGQLMFESTLAFVDNQTGEDVNMKIKLQGYGSTTSSLSEDKIYFLSGRLISPNSKTPPVLYYDQEMTFPIADLEGYSVSLANKAGCYGFGVVVSKAEAKDESSSVTQFNNLFVKIRHTDYDVQIAGNRNLAKAFGLFQIGQEVVISGYIAGYSFENRMLEVNALSVSVSAGQTSTNATNLQDAGPLNVKTRRLIQINFKSDNEGSAADPGSTQFLLPNSQHSGPDEGFSKCKAGKSSGQDITTTPPKKHKYTKRSAPAVQDEADQLVPEAL
ncbi:hypothetical protein PtA15_13A174 [Puccinia triticina]|uniref:Uncharacterized protein n=1 Tax=Puccinia triticina TaxID=208348 RepID=A0ABY7D0K9_9BASI|nr:uncharacterized protein PtA15_13A174 [Puccinia triticina]WAQ90775.1 hypothetical protein PtA15_13A174 [Puccinia triticina]